MIETGNIQIPLGDEIALEACLDIPVGARGIVLFVQTSGRISSRNRFMARQLRENGQATLLLDLLTSEEGRIDERTSHFRFDIELLTERLLGATCWVKKQKGISSLKRGFFGAGTGTAAALGATIQDPKIAEAVVSRGGRPDLAGTVLPKVKCPTLLIVGECDDIVVDQNQRAKNLLTCESKLEIIAEAGHLFEEPRALDKVARLASEWFSTYLV